MKKNLKERFGYTAYNIYMFTGASAALALCKYLHISKITANIITTITTIASPIFNRFTYIIYILLLQLVITYQFLFIFYNFVCIFC